MTAVDDRQLDGAIFTAKGINLTLGGNRILRDVAFEVHDVIRAEHTTGQVVGLLGPSGVGKTQLFRILAGLNQPDSGEVRIGKAQVPVRRGMVGVVAQSYPLFNHRTVLGNLTVAGTQAGLDRATSRTQSRELLERFDLADRAKAYPAQLSGGQRQRVAIAQQLMSQNHLLLMDEPFSGLDPVQVDNVIELIFEVAALHEENTIVVVTHDITSAVLAADTIWLMGRDRDEAGQPIAGARIQELVDLVPLGLAWWQRPTYGSPGVQACVAELRARFETL